MIDRIILTFLIIGGVNWGSIGLFEFDIIGWLCGGQNSIVSRIIFIIIGLSAIWCISFFIKPTEMLLDD